MGSPLMPYEEETLLQQYPLRGWRDQLGEINVRGTGANDPSWSQIGSSNFYAYAFPGTGTQLKQFWHNCHVQHDYALLSNLFPHIHWLPETNGTGNVCWNVSYTMAKGHNQAAYDFDNPTTIQIVQAAPGIKWQHMIAEASENQAISGVTVEPDTIIKFRIWRDPTDVLDTYGAIAYSDFVDNHYQTDRFSTFQRNPNFNRRVP